MQYIPARGFKNCWLSIHLCLASPLPPTSVFLAPPSPLDLCPLSSPLVCWRSPITSCAFSEEKTLVLTAVITDYTSGRKNPPHLKLFFFFLFTQPLSSVVARHVCRARHRLHSCVPAHERNMGGPHTTQGRTAQRVLVLPCLLVFVAQATAGYIGAARPQSSGDFTSAASPPTPSLARHLFGLFTHMQMQAKPRKNNENTNEITQSKSTPLWVP